MVEYNMQRLVYLLTSSLPFSQQPPSPSTTSATSLTEYWSPGCVDFRRFNKTDFYGDPISEVNYNQTQF